MTDLTIFGAATLAVALALGIELAIRLRAWRKWDQQRRRARLTERLLWKVFQ